MKTFRLVSLFLLLKEEKDVYSYRVPLQEGLIINREERNKSWLIEAVLPQSEEETFRPKMEAERQMVLEVVITDTHNDPALMTGRVRSIVPLESRISVIFDAVMASGKDDVSNMILEGLIEEGYSGHDMLSEFYQRKQDQGKWSKQAAARIYEQLGSTESRSKK
ncbi:YwpF family protein [Salibacterium qingdaonense]|uniref:YwpF-like protein n=1 Tax=Salibacterium qingdaonense TaxID=266892 RepID=A0A1I4MZA9_9BACI|nr:YwpF family protein [Salibacterium qingdaonense]SFM08672.1 YwpF-like protein [Salibacterium qingdaonense]